MLLKTEVPITLQETGESLHDKLAEAGAPPEDGPLDGRCPAILRQQGGMDIDAAKRRHIKNLFGKDLAEG